MHSRSTLLIVAILSATLATPACTTTRPLALDPPNSPPVGLTESVKPGSNVVIRLIDGDEFRATVVSVDDYGLSVRASSRSEERRVAYSDMRSLQVRQPSRGRTTLAAVGAGIVVALGIAYYQLVVVRGRNSD